MLPLLTDYCTIVLRPNSIDMIRSKGIFKPKLVASSTIVLDQTNYHAALLQALSSQINKPEWQGCKTKVILAGDLVRYRVAKWDDRLNTAEQFSLVSHEFGQVYGEQMQGWKISLAKQKFGRNNLACAVNQDFLNSLLNIFKAQDLPVNLVQPGVATWVNFLRGHIAPDAWLILVDAQHLYLLKFKQGDLQILRDIKTSIDSDVQLEQYIIRELLTDGEVLATQQLSCYWLVEKNISIKSEKLTNMEILNLRLSKGEPESYKWAIYYA